MAIKIISWSEKWVGVRGKYVEDVTHQIFDVCFVFVYCLYGSFFHKKQLLFEKQKKSKIWWVNLSRILPSNSLPIFSTRK